MLHENREQSGKTTFTEVITTRIVTVALLFVLSISLLLLAKTSIAETSGMINRAPLVKTTPKPTALQKISTDLGDIIKSINEASTDAEDTNEEETVTAEPEKPVEKNPVKTPKTPVPVIAQPKKTAPAPDKIKTVKSTPRTNTDEPVIAKPEQLKAATKKVTLTKPAPQPVKKQLTKSAYLKLAASGEKLQSDTTTWDCVVDTNNGLVWEVKSDNGGLRDKDHLYSWFDPSQNSGSADGGRCKGDIRCDTNAYIQAMNKQNFCGHDDWRLPTREEMQSLVYLENNKVEAKINKEYFPEALPSWYWTASSNEKDPSYAWYVLFRNGISLNDLKARPKHIRLVRKDGNA